MASSGHGTLVEFITSNLATNLNTCIATASRRLFYCTLSLSWWWTFTMAVGWDGPCMESDRIREAETKAGGIGTRFSLSGLDFALFLLWL